MERRSDLIIGLKSQSLLEAEPEEDRMFTEVMSSEMFGVTKGLSTPAKKLRRNDLNVIKLVF